MTKLAAVDVLVITHRSSEYARRTIQRLFEVCPSGTRIWLWHNGDDEETLEVGRSAAANDLVHRFYHSRENVRLREPTNWLWANAEGEFVSKVDDDCLEHGSWLPTLVRAHEDFRGFGAIAAWRFPAEDFQPQIAHRKIANFGGHLVMQNFWVQGSGYLMRRATVERFGFLRDKDTWTGWCMRLARAGLVNGWYFPFIPEEHMDDPRSEHTLLTSDQELLDRRPLSAEAKGIRTLSDWEDQMKRSARELQAASINPKDYWGPSAMLRKVMTRTGRSLSPLLPRWRPRFPR